MCLTLPKVLISLIGIEKVIPKFRDLEVFLQLLPRSATGERMNPYNSIWTGVTPGSGPEEFHVVLLNNGRTWVLADEEARETLDCIRWRRLLERMPGVPADRGPRVWVHLFGPYRGNSNAAVAGNAACAIVAVCVVIVRRLL